MAGNPYYAGTYWARSYFGGGGDAPEGSIYATISGASQLSVSFTAVAFISANISGFAMVVADAETAGGVRDIAATLLGSSTVSANLTIPGHVVDLQKPIGGGGGSGGTPAGSFITYARHFREEPVPIFLSANLGGSSKIAADVSATADLAANIVAEATISVSIRYTKNFVQSDNEFWAMAA